MLLLFVNMNNTIDYESEWYTEGYILQYDEIIMNPEVWELQINKSLVGKSGISHMLDFLATSDHGRILFLNADCNANSILSITGKLHALKLDLGIEKGFIVCGNFQEGRENINGLPVITDQIISGVRLRRTLQIGTYDDTQVTPAFQHMSSNIKRDRTKIIADIMQLLSTERNGITGIIYKCNLNYKSATRIINDLMEKKYVEIQKNNEKSLYSLTPDGLEILKAISKFVNLSKLSPP